MARIIIVGQPRLSSFGLSSEIVHRNATIAVKSQIELNEEPKYMPNNIIMPIGFGEENQSFDDPKSKYINKPKRNFKRR